jgi:ABC-type antimicrobial peptide transport system permease subunit
VQPLGKRVSFDNGQTWVTIVGVVGDAKEYGLDRPIADETYVPLKQAHFAGNLVLRVASSPESVTSAVRAALRRIDPEIAVDRVSTIQAFVDESVAAPRTTAALLGSFSGLALLISAAGIAAVMALHVNQRRHELGIRIALGATHGSVLRLVVLQGVALAAAGIAIGLAGALTLGDLLSSMLYGVGPRDTATLAAAAALFLCVGAVSCFVPGRQVTGLDPVVALRQD